MTETVAECNAFVPSTYQAAIFEDVRTGTWNTVVRARAGAGKTKTIEMALGFVPKGRTVGLFAFNKSIQLELAKRAPKGVEVKTLHAHGYSALLRAFPALRNASPDKTKSQQICVSLFGSPNEHDPLRSRYYELAELVRHAKNTLVARGDLDALDELVERFHIDTPSVEEFTPRPLAPLSPKATDEEKAAYLEKERVHAEACAAAPAKAAAAYEDFLKAAMTVLERSVEITSVVDFEDMCWLPVVLGLRVWAYNVVFVDETQDLSPCQIELLLMCVRRGGRIIAVGDDRQAIYAFRGADVDTIARLIERLDARVLPLSVTYRCCRAVVRIAQQEVADFQAAPNAPEGSITRSVRPESMLEKASAGDMIVSRTNAPLLGFCLKFLRAGKRAKIMGRNIGEGIVRMIKRSEAKTLTELTEWLSAWHAREIERLSAKERSTDEADDQLECILALVRESSTVAEVVDHAQRLFADDTAEGTITLGTTHKLKGLEATRVWMLEDTYRPRFGGEEANCWYVAVTRAKTDLRMVLTKDKKELQ